MVYSNLKQVVSAASLVFVLGLFGCDDKLSAQSAGKSIDQAAENTVDTMKNTAKTISDDTAKVGDAIGDSAITAKVKAVILAEPGLNVLDISVDTKHNITTLTGSVDSQKNSAKAEEITKAVDGVNSVDNQLLVVAAQ